MHLFARRLAAAGCAVFVCFFACSGKAEAATANTIRGEFGLQLSQDIAPLRCYILMRNPRKMKDR